MPTLATGISIKSSRRGVAQRGFTLLEIMLVVVLIGITVTFVNLKLGPDPEQTVKREGDRVAALLGQLVDESILRGRVMAMTFDEAEQRYGFETLSGSEWKTISRHELFYPRRFARPVVGSLQVDGSSSRPDDERIESSGETDDEANRADGRSRVIVDPVGGISDFNLSLQAEGYRVLVSLDEYANVISRPIEAQ